MIKLPRPRLADVARAADVSLGTASNVFAHPERVRAEVRERVEAVARALGYAGADPMGRLLREGTVNAIGVVAPGNWGVADALRNPVYRQFMTGAAETCDARGANLVVVSDPERGGVRTALVDGFILSRVEHIRDIEPVRRRRLPFVLIDFDAGPEIGSVRVDARAGAREAARHLVALGHRQFAILSFLRDFAPALLYPPGGARPPEAAGMQIDQEKFAGYREALAEAGIAIDTVPMVQAHPWDPAAARLLLDAAPGATAILAMAAMQAIAVMGEARRRGLSVPHDLSVVGFNDIPEAAASVPPLTTVDGMSEEKGRIAARMLFEGGPVRQEVLATRLILRGSTATARG